jgi:hypothetical protein
MSRTEIDISRLSWYAPSLPQWKRLAVLINTVHHMEMQWAILP